MNSRSGSITSSPNEEEFGPFGQSAISMLEMLFPRMYRAVIVTHPTFSDAGRANISPQFQRGEFCVLSIVKQPPNSGSFVSNLSRFGASKDAEDLLDHYRYEHAIFASNDLSILTAWAQAEYAVVAFKEALISEYEEWFDAMHAMEVLRKID